MISIYRIKIVNKLNQKYQSIDKDRVNAMECWEKCYRDFYFYLNKHIYTQTNILLITKVDIVCIIGEPAVCSMPVTLFLSANYKSIFHTTYSLLYSVIYLYLYMYICVCGINLFYCRCFYSTDTYIIINFRL